MDEPNVLLKVKGLFNDIKKDSDWENWILTECLKLYFSTQSDEVKLECLKLIRLINLN